MKKFLIVFALLLSMVMGVSAQNYAGSSKFTDNVAVTLQGGVVTPFNDFFKNGSTTPIVVLGVEKYVNPWLGFGIEGRTSIGISDNYNLHTAFDMVNVSGVAKINVLNLINFNGTRRFFEPVVYTGLGWGHVNCSNIHSLSGNYAVGGVPTEYLGVIHNFLTYRAGVECNFNLNNGWGIVVNPSVVWGNIDNARLCKANGNFEVTAGVVYHFKTSNGTHTFAKAHLYDQAEIDALNARINELEHRPATIIEKIVEKPATASIHNDVTYAVNFAQNSAELSDAAKAILDKVPANSNVSIVGSTSPEGSYSRNCELALERALAVSDYLRNRGVNVVETSSGENARAAIITVK